MIDPKIICSRS